MGREKVVELINGGKLVVLQYAYKNHQKKMFHFPLIR